MGLIKKHKINFSKYFGIGLIATILSVAFSYLFIDVFGVRAIIASPVVGIGIFLFKYFGYRKINLIKNRFVSFGIINVAFTILYIVLNSFFIDILKFPTLLVVSIVTIVLFITRYLALYLARIIVE